MKRFNFLILIMVGMFALHTQAQTSLGKTTLNGQLVTLMLDDNGDTILVADDLMTVSLTSPRQFKSREEYLRYRKYLRYAAIVYPYAKEAIIVFRELEAQTLEMKKGKRKKYAKKLQKDLDDKFEEPLKNLTKTQGKILVKMVERELNDDLHNLIKTYRGGMTAGYWNTLSKFWGYDLKEGYIEGQDPILDAVLQDFNISYKLN
ncbi:MAG: DUF4294 domain-containing protein [Saprospiraceae bacterium]